MSTIDEKTGRVLDEPMVKEEIIPPEFEGVIEESIAPILAEGKAHLKEFFTGVFQRVAANTKEMRDDLIDELDEETQYSSEDVAQYINSAINDTLAIVSDELPLAQDDRPLTDFYFEIVNT